MDLLTGHAVVIPIEEGSFGNSIHDYDSTDFLTTLGYNLGLIGVTPSSIAIYPYCYRRTKEKQGNYLIVVFDNPKDAFNYTMLATANLSQADFEKTDK